MKRLRAEEQGEMETIKTANLLLSLSREGRPEKSHKPEDGVFECRTCGRRFPSFQALGGHRTGHKRPRVQGPGLDLLQGSGLKPTAHECPICGQRFSMGQALGGHMRRHKPTSEALPEKKAGAEKSMLDFNLIPLQSDCKRQSFGGVLLELFV